MLFGGEISTLEDVGGGDSVASPYIRRSGAEIYGSSPWVSFSII